MYSYLIRLSEFGKKFQCSEIDILFHVSQKTQNSRNIRISFKFAVLVKILFKVNSKVPFLVGRQGLKNL